MAPKRSIVNWIVSSGIRAHQFTGKPHSPFGWNVLAPDKFTLKLFDESEQIQHRWACGLVIYGDHDILIHVILPS